MKRYKNFNKLLWLPYQYNKNENKILYNKNNDYEYDVGY